MSCANRACEGTVAVQARQTIEETEWLLDLADAIRFILGVVGWVPLAARMSAAIWSASRSIPGSKAVRHVLHDEPDDFYMLRDDFNRGISLLRRLSDWLTTFLIFERHLPQTIEFVDRHPGQIFVIDHIAKPQESEMECSRRGESE